MGTQMFCRNIGEEVYCLVNNGYCLLPEKFFIIKISITEDIPGLPYIEYKLKHKNKDLYKVLQEQDIYDQEDIKNLYLFLQLINNVPDKYKNSKKIFEKMIRIKIKDIVIHIKKE